MGALMSGTHITQNGVPVPQLQVLIYNFASGQCDINTVMSAVDNENCFVMDRSCVYILQSDSHTVKVFSFDGTPKYSIYTPYNILRLLYDSSVDRVYALSDRQIFAVNGKSIELLGNISSPAELAGRGIVCTGDGTVYSVNGSSLEYLCTVPGGRGAAVVGDIIYFCDNTVIYGQNYSGEKIYSLNIGQRAEKVFPHGNSIGILCENVELMIVSPSEMREIPRETQPANHGNGSSNSSPSGGGSSGGSSSGGGNASNPAPSGEVHSSVYAVDKSGMTISGIAPQTSLAKFKQNMSCSGYSVSFKNYSGASKTSGSVGTGFTAYFYGQRQFSFTLIVTGDLTGEGNINSLDVKRYMQHLCGRNELEQPFYFAADINGDGACDTLDLLAAARY